MILFRISVILYSIDNLTIEILLKDQVDNNQLFGGDKKHKKNSKDTKNAESHNASLEGIGADKLPVFSQAQQAGFSAPSYAIGNKKEGQEEQGEKETKSNGYVQTTGGDLPNETPNQPNSDEQPVTTKEKKNGIKGKKKNQGKDKAKDQTEKDNAKSEKEGVKNKENTKKEEKKGKDKTAQNKQASKQAKKGTDKKTSDKAQKINKKHTAAGIEGINNAVTETNKVMNDANNIVSPTSNAPAVSDSKATKPKPNAPGNLYAVKPDSKDQISGDVISTTAGGNMLVSTNGPINDAGEKGAQPVPQSVIQGQEQERSAANKPKIDQLANQNKSKIAQLKQRGASKLSQMQIRINSAKMAIEAAEQAATQKLNTDIQNGLNQINQKFEQAKGTIDSQFATTQTEINTAATKAIADLQTELSTAQNNARSSIAGLVKDGNLAINNEIKELKKTAFEQGNLAVKQANARSIIEGQAKPKEMSGWDKFWSGKDYEKNKIKARVEACKQVGTDKQKEFNENAESSIVELENAKAKTQEIVTKNMNETATNFAAMHQQKVAQINAEKQQNLAQAQQIRTNQLNALEQGKQSQIQSLNQLKASKSAEIKQSAGQQKMAVNTMGNGAVSGFRQTLSQGIGALQNANQDMIGNLSQNNQVSQSAFNGIIASSTASFNSKADHFGTQLDQGSSETISSVSQSENQASTALNQISSGAETAIKSTTQASSSAADNIVSQAKTQLSGLVTSTTNSFNKTVTTAKTDYATKLELVKKAVLEKIKEANKELFAKSQQVKSNILSEMKNLGTIMDKAAKEAEDKVQPAWKKFLKIFIEVVAAIALAVAVAALATVLGPFALILAAVAIGALLGVGKQILNNALDGKKWNDGLLKAAVMGGIEGLFAAIGAGALTKGLGNLASKSTTLMKFAGPVKKFASKGVAKVIGSIAKDVSKAMTEQIATNILDGKSWHKDLLKTAGTATIDAVIDVGMGGITGKLSDKIKSKGPLQDSLKSSVGKKIAQETAEIAIDTTSDYVGDGIKNVAKNGKEILSSGSISEGLGKVKDKFNEGANEKSLAERAFKSTLNRAKDPAVNKTKQSIAKKMAKSQGISDRVVPEGYELTVTDGKKQKPNENRSRRQKVWDAIRNDRAQVDLRPKAKYNAKGDREMADLTYGENGKISRRGSESFAAHTSLKSKKQHDADIDPTKLLPKDVRGRLYNYAKQGLQGKYDALLAEHDHTIAKSRNIGLANSPSGKLAAQKGLPQPPKGYHYNTAANGTLYIKRTRKIVNGVEQPELKIEGNRLRYVNESDVGKNPVVDLAVSFKPNMTKEHIAASQKGSRKDPSTYLDEAYLKRHTERFKKEGIASRVVLKSAHEKYGVGKPDKGKTEFVSTKTQIDQILKEANGDVYVIAKKLGIEPSDLKGTSLVRIDFKVTNENIAVATGNEFGTNEKWIPGGLLPDGNIEAIIKTQGLKEGRDYTVTDI